jgi:hypothetical protein
MAVFRRIVILPRGPRCLTVRFDHPDPRCSSSRQIRNCSGQIGIVDQLQAAFTAVLTGRDVRGVFGISNEGLDAEPCQSQTVSARPRHRLLDFRARKIPVSLVAANILPIIREVQGGGHMSYNAIAAQLNARKVAAARGGRWTQVQVGQILKRPPGVSAPSRHMTARRDSP